MRAPKADVVRGVFWTGGEKVLVQTVALAQYLILARLLAPSDFGHVAMLGVFFAIGGELADAGLSRAFVVYGGPVRRIWLWNVGFAAGLYLLLGCASPLIAAFYGVPDLVRLVWALGLTTVIGAAGSVYGAWLTRAMRFRELAWTNVARTVGGAAVGIALAGWGLGVWALVGMGLATAVIRTALLGWFARRLASPPAPPSAAPPRFGTLLSYGWKATASSLLCALSDNCAYLLVGKAATPADVGLFERGNRFAFLPVNTVMDALSRVMFPRFSELRRAGGRLRASALSFAALGCALSWPCLLALGVWAPEAVRLALGANWLGCVPYLRVLLLGYALLPLVHVSANLLMGGGRSDLALKADALKTPVLVGLLLVGIRWGVLGVCWAKVVGNVVEAGVNALFAAKMFRDASRGGPS